MPDSPEVKRARAKAYYAANAEEKRFKSAVRGIIDGRKPSSKTLAAYRWGEREINRIRALDPRFRAVLEDTHGVELEGLYANKTPLPPLNLPRVQVSAPPAQPPRPDYPQCLEETPEKGTGTPITWAQIETFWSGEVEKHNMGTSSARKIMRDGKLVAETYSKVYLDDVRRTFRQIRTEFAKADPGDNAVPVLRDAEGVMAWLRAKNTKTIIQVEADATAMDSAAGAVAARDDDDEEEVSSGSVATSVAGKRARARTKSTALKQVTQSYSKKLGHITTTFGAWGVFRDSLGTDVLQTYRGGFGEGEVGLFQAIQADREVQGNKAKSDLHAVPSYEMLVRYLPKIKSALGPSTTWLAAFLQVKLLGLRDNLGGIEIRGDDGRRFDPTVGDPSREDWYNRLSGEIYIAHFKTGKSRFGTPYSFDLSKHSDIKAAVDATLAPGHPETDRKWLVGIGRKKDGLPLPAGPKVKKAFIAAGLTFKQIHNGRLIDTSVTPLDVRHAQVTWKHREMSRRKPSLTATQISEKIAGFFNHASDVNIGYLRKTFDSLESHLATKSTTNAPTAALQPVQEAEEEEEEEERLEERRESNAKATTSAPTRAKKQPVNALRARAPPPRKLGRPVPPSPKSAPPPPNLGRPVRKRVPTQRAVESAQQQKRRGDARRRRS